MKTMNLALALVLLAAPVWAKVTIEVIQRPGELVADVNYTSDEAVPVRAFAIDITVDAGVITDVCDYVVGDDNFGYGIFPANFSLHVNVDQSGNVESWDSPDYTPVAPGTDPGALGGLDTNGITIEMGALYEDNGPGQSGRLCSIKVSEDCTVGLALNGMRGNVVLETAAEPGEVELLGAEITTGEPDCFPDSYPGYAAWEHFGKPDCWCYARQCYGDADGKKQGSNFAGWMYVYTDDLGVLVDAWQVKEPPKASLELPNGIVDVPNGICADFDHDQQGSNFAGWMRVYTNDLAVLINAWQAKEPPKHDPEHPYFPNGIPGDCVPVPVEPEP